MYGGKGVMTIKVAVIDEQEIFRHGLVSALRDDASVKVVLATEDVAVERDDVDVAVVATDKLDDLRLKCPIIVLSEGEAQTSAGTAKNIDVLAVVSRDVSAEQIVVTVRAVAAGLHVNADRQDASGEKVLDDRQLKVLGLLAAGADTRTIARKLMLSERTVKSVVHDIELKLGASNRAEAVAEGIRSGLI
jgi:DNA-binding NarL/FixJ family response regulator